MRPPAHRGLRLRPGGKSEKKEDRKRNSEVGMRKSEKKEDRRLRAEDFEFDGSWFNVKTKGLHLPEPLLFMVPEGRIELPRTQGPLDFESSASTNFTTPALFWLYI